MLKENEEGRKEVLEKYTERKRQELKEEEEARKIKQKVLPSKIKKVEENAFGFCDDEEEGEEEKQPERKVSEEYGDEFDDVEEEGGQPSGN